MSIIMSTIMSTKCPQNVHNNSNKIDKKILDIILQEPQITQKNIATKLKTTSKTIQRGIATLKEKGKIERIGSSRKGYWKIID